MGCGRQPGVRLPPVLRIAARLRPIGERICRWAWSRSDARSAAVTMSRCWKRRRSRRGSATSARTSGDVRMRMLSAGQMRRPIVILQTTARGMARSKRSFPQAASGATNWRLSQKSERSTLYPALRGTATIAAARYGRSNGPCVRPGSCSRRSTSPLPPALRPPPPDSDRRVSIPDCDCQLSTPDRDCRPRLPTADCRLSTPDCDRRPRLTTADCRLSTPNCDCRPRLTTVDCRLSTPNCDCRPRLTTADRRLLTPDCDCRLLTPDCDCRPRLTTADHRLSTVVAVLCVP
jgi:hypothetical protein